MNNVSNDTSFLKLQEWYLEQCNGDWEHEFGINIDTFDNPGWSLRINLTGTPLEEKSFTRMRQDFTEDNWIHCWITDKKFQAG